MSDGDRRAPPRALLLGAVLLLTAPLGAGGQQVDWEALSPRFQGATFVRNDETCADCHDGMVHRFGLSGHAASFKAGSTAVWGGCESCHGPRSLHVHDGEPILAGSDLSTDQQSNICMQCHAGGPRMAFKAGAHQGADVSCTSCHEAKSPEGTPLEWRNVWASGSGPFDTWDRAVGTWGRRPLAPDNTYHNALFTAGVALPFDSRLTATFSRGVMDQDADLVPYAYQVDMLANRTLPRSTAQASMSTTHLAAEYFIAPFKRVTARAFFRSFDLENETPTSQWQYVTQDAANLTGTVSYVNKRQNEPIAWARRNLGGEATLRFGLLRSSLTLGGEQEIIDREHRQVEESVETILRASWRARPTDWMSVRTSYMRGNRNGSEYDWRVASESYWYTAADNPDNNDPMTSFEDHPDMRKYDLADRKRQRFDATVIVVPADAWSLSAGARIRSDDYDSDVEPSQPLASLSVVDRAAFTPGDQLGLLKSESRQVSADLAWSPSDRFGLSATYGFDVGESNMRSLEFNENNKKNPSAVNTAQLGPWTRKSSQWTADFEDRTHYAGFGGQVDLVPGRRR